MRRNQWTAILVALLLVAFGFVSGLLAERYFSTQVVNARTAEDFRHSYTAEMKEKLHLSPSQVAQLEVILDETKARYKAVRDEYRPAMLKIKDEQISRVKGILRPEQVPGYERLVAEREQRFHEQEERDRAKDEKRAAAHRASAGK